MNFTLRKWQMSDAESVEKYANNPKIAANLRNVFPYPYKIDDAKEYIKSCIDADKQKQLCRAIEVNGEAVGSVGIFLKDDVYCKTAEIGYWLGEPFWGNGIMSKAISALCVEAFERYDIIRIYAEPFAYNAGSRRALEKAGFTLEGVMKNSVYKNGTVYDSCMYALLK